MTDNNILRKNNSEAAKFLGDTHDFTDDVSEQPENLHFPKNLHLSLSTSYLEQRTSKENILPLMGE